MRKLQDRRVQVSVGHLVAASPPRGETWAQGRGRSAGVPRTRLYVQGAPAGAYAVLVATAEQLRGLAEELDRRADYLDAIDER